MSEIQFASNVTDRSVHSGPNAGFQFDFHCDRCWGKGKGLCFNCVPDVEVAIEAARAEGERQAAAERAAAAGAKRAQNRDVKRDRQLVCP